MNIKMIVLTNGFEFGACFNIGNGWRCELCATEKAAYSTLATLLQPADKLFLTTSLYCDTKDFFWEDKKEHPNFDAFDPIRIHFMEEATFYFRNEQLEVLTSEDKAAARVAFVDEMMRCR